MNYKHLWVVARVYLLAWLALSGQIAGQEQGVVIALGSAEAVPGGEFSLPLTLKASSKDRLGMLAIEMSLPEALSFVEVKGGAAAEVAGAEIKKEASEGKPGSAVKISVEAKGTMPSGILASLTFKLSDNIDMEEIELEPKARAWTLDKRPVDGIRVEKGKVQVIPPLISCFFYMH